MKCIDVNINIVVIEGGTFDKIFQWKVGNPLVPVDLTGYTASMNIRLKTKSDEILLNVPNQNNFWRPDAPTGVYIFDNDEYDEYDENGKWRIYLRDDDTKGLCTLHKEVAGVYDLFLTTPQSETVLKQYGTCTIKPAVTREENG